MNIFWARLASFGLLGLISDPPIVSKFHNELHDPKGQENKIYTIVKYVLLRVPRRCLFCGSFFVIYVSCLSGFLVCSVQPCGHLLGKADLLALLYVMFYCILSFPPVVSWVRNGALVYRFLIFAFCLTWCILQNSIIVLKTILGDFCEWLF